MTSRNKLSTLRTTIFREFHLARGIFLIYLSLTRAAQVPNKEMIETKIDKERREFLVRLAKQISTEMMSQGFTSFENVSDEVWDDAFLESIHPLLDNAIADYKLGAHDIFFMGVWFGQQ